MSATQDTPGGIRFKYSAPFESWMIRAMRELVLETVRTRGLDQKVAWDLASVMDELACNIVEHAGATWFEGELELNPEKPAKLVIRDNGLAFDVPFVATRGETIARDFEDRGMGLLMVKRLMGKMDYRRRDDGVNELVLSAPAGVQGSEQVAS